MWGSGSSKAARRMFPISRRREDVHRRHLHGGRTARSEQLQVCENFGGIIALSSYRMMRGDDRLITTTSVFFLSRNFPWNPPLATYAQVIDSDKDHAVWPPTWSIATAQAARLHSMGSNDPLARPIAHLPSACEAPASVEQREMPGGHDWTFWNTALPQALDWLPR